MSLTRPAHRDLSAARAGVLLLAAAVTMTGCSLEPPEAALVLTQVPILHVTNQAGSLLDQRYPTGSRIVLALRPFSPANLRVLSPGLAAAGDAVVGPNGRTVVFAGKATASSPWQIYEASLSGSGCKQLTHSPGGAMDPAIIADGQVVFSSPVPKSADLWTRKTSPALYGVMRGSAPRRLTFGASAAVEPTVLADGRILFVSALPMSRECDGQPDLGLFTINTDGTEVTRFALDHDGWPIVHRPRELSDGRVAFMAADRDQAARPEAVRKARPFGTRAPLWSFKCGRCKSIEPEGEGMLLACLDTRGAVGRTMIGSIAVFRISTDAKMPGEPIFQDPAWDTVEAVPLVARTAMGHISAMAKDKASGTILCLDANFTRHGPAKTVPKAERVRVLTAAGQDKAAVLGEVPLQLDGSFMAEVPADTALGFETLDGQGNVIQHLAPALWVRPGENRTCIGCHEPYNRSPRNVRPLAVTVPPVVLTKPKQMSRADILK